MLLSKSVINRHVVTCQCGITGIIRPQFHLEVHFSEKSTPHFRPGYGPDEYRWQDNSDSQAQEREGHALSTKTLRSHVTQTRPITVEIA